MVEPWRSHGGALVEQWWSNGGAMLEPWWSRGGAKAESRWSHGGATVNEPGAIPRPRRGELFLKPPGIVPAYPTAPTVPTNPISPTTPDHSDASVHTGNRGVAKSGRSGEPIDLGHSDQPDQPGRDSRRSQDNPRWFQVHLPGDRWGDPVSHVSWRDAYNFCRCEKRNGPHPAPPPPPPPPGAARFSTKVLTNGVHPATSAPARLLLVTHTITQSRRERARAGGRPRPVLPLAGEADADGGRVGVRRPRRAGREDLPVGRRAVRPQAEGGGSADEELADPVGSESCDAGRSFRLARMLPGSLMCSPDAVSDPSSKNRIVWSGESP
eukprot:gene12869-biopygen6078